MDFAQEALHNRMLDVCEGKALEASLANPARAIPKQPDHPQAPQAKEAQEPEEPEEPEEDAADEVPLCVSVR